MTKKTKAVVSPVPADDDRKGIQSVEFAFLILQVLQKAAGSMAIKEIADALAVPPSKIHHYLVSLARTGVVVQRQDSGRYALGDFALQLGLSALTLLDPSEIAFAAAQEFRNLTGESIFVAVYGNRGPTIIRYLEGNRILIVEVRAGMVLPLLNSAVGRIFLAWLPEELWMPIACQERPRLAERGNSEREKVRKLAAAIRTAGVASIKGELLPKMAALSVPVFDKDARLVLALTALGWGDEFDANPKGKLATQLKKTGAAVSRALGYRE